MIRVCNGMLLTDCKVTTLSAGQWLIYRKLHFFPRCTTIVYYLRGLASSRLGSLKEVSCKVPVSPFILSFFTKVGDKQTMLFSVSANTHER